MRYQLENPSAEDLNPGLGHRNAALAILNVIEEQNDIGVIGLEGELGAGKSTIIKILCDRLDSDKYDVIHFDVDKYHSSSIKASFLKVVGDGIKRINKNDLSVCRGVDQVLNASLGKLLKYDKKTQSNINFILIILAASLVFFVKFFYDSVLSFFDTVQSVFNGHYEFSLEKTLKTILGISPVLMYPLIVHHNVKNPDNKISLGSVIKKDSIDTITEIIDVNKEVDSFDLQKAFQLFISYMPEDKKLILIIDNLDRVDENKVREVWSDIDVFTSCGGDRLKIILPFSEVHVEKAISNKDDLRYGYEYLLKRLPVVFRAPPIVSAGWRKQYQQYWMETLPEHSEVNQSAELIDIWLSESYQITPRFLKRHINDIRCSFASIPELHLNSIVCSAYLLSRYHIRGIDLRRTLLSKNIESVPDEFKDRIALTQDLLRRYVGEESSWAYQIACFHYQTTRNVAESEILFEPIKESYYKPDSGALLGLSNVFGFDVFFLKVVTKSTPESVVSFLINFDSLNDDIKVKWYERWKDNLHSIMCNSSTSAYVDKNYVNGVQKLNAAGYNLPLAHLESKTNALSEKICKENDFKFANISELRDEISSLHLCSKICNILPKIILDLDIHLFVRVLWFMRDEVDFWAVLDDDIDTEDFPIYLNAACDFYSEICDSEIVYDYSKIFYWLSIKSKAWILSGKNDISKLNGDTVWDVRIEPASFIYHECWGKAEFYKKINSLLKDGDFSSVDKSCVVAMLFLHIVSNAHHSYTVDIEIEGKSQKVKVTEYFKDYFLDDNFSKYAIEVSPSIKNFSSFLLYLDNDYFNGVSDDILIHLISKQLVNALVLDSFIKKTYAQVRSVFVNKSGESSIYELLTWFATWAPSVKNKNIKLNDWSAVLIKDIFSYNIVSFVKAIDLQLAANEMTEKNWIDIIVDMDENYAVYFDSFKHSPVVRKKVTFSPAIYMKDIIVSEKLIGGNEDIVIENLVRICRVVDERKLNEFYIECNKIILDHTVVEDSAYLIIKAFGRNVKLLTAKDSQNVGRIISLIKNAASMLVLEWLSTQQWKLGSWTKEELNELRMVIDKTRHVGYSKLLKSIDRALNSRG